MNSKIGLLFSGQGAQAVGMGKDLYEKSAAARALYDQADAILGWPLSQYGFEGPAEKLTDTSVCQPALYVHGLALLAVVRAARPELAWQGCAGLSLGEYTAHAAAGTFDFATGLRLVAERGRLMQEACEKSSGAMISLLGADVATAQTVAAEADWDVANVNSPGQVVVAGIKENAAKVIESAKAHGIKRAVPLNVAGAYHSRLMESAKAGLVPHLNAAQLVSPQQPVWANVDGKLASDPAAIREKLAAQVCGTVQWQACIEAMVAAGIERFLELGPSGVLAGLVKRISPGVPCASLGTWAECEAFASADLASQPAGASS